MCAPQYVQQPKRRQGHRVKSMCPGAIASQSIVLDEAPGLGDVLDLSHLQNFDPGNLVHDVDLYGSSQKAVPEFATATACARPD